MTVKNDRIDSLYNDKTNKMDKILAKFKTFKNLSKSINLQKLNIQNNLFF